MQNKLIITVTKPWKDYVKVGRENLKRIYPKRKSFPKEWQKNHAYRVAITDLEEPYNTIANLCRGFENQTIDQQYVGVLPNLENPQAVQFRVVVNISGSKAQDQEIQKVYDNLYRDLYGILTTELRKLDYTYEVL